MENSTLYRSNLTKEKMAILEELQSEAQEQENNLSVYKRPLREKELDVLWKNFKVNQRNEKTPGVYLTIGFILGAVCMFMMTAVLSFGTTAAERPSTTEIVVKRPQEKTDLFFIPKSKETKDVAKTTNSKKSKAVETSETPASYQNYTVVSGDTLERIIIRFYGKNDVSKIDKIVEANKLSSPNSLSIGQKLVIPMD